MEVREAVSLDFDNGFFEALETLAPVGKISPRLGGEILFDRRCSGISTLVAVLGNQVFGTASWYIERKFIHQGGRVAHVEDVAVRSSSQGVGIGRLLMGHIEIEARHKGCYKIILDCSDKNIGFYEKCGYYKKESEMRKDL